MGKIDFEPWEPEETVGKLWHNFASRLGAPQVHHGAAVDLSEIGGRLAVLFRGLGGRHDVELRPVAPETSRHRLGWLRRLGTEAELTPRASFDGEVLRLPEQLAVFPSREANAALYIWLTAAAVHLTNRPDETDPLIADLMALRSARTMMAATLDAAPGLGELLRTLSLGVLQERPDPAGYGREAQVEAVIRHMLGDPLSRQGRDLWQIVSDDAPIEGLAAPRGYQPFRPVPLWPEMRPVLASATSEVETAQSEGTQDESSEGTRRARRQKSEQAERSDSFILHKFEAILSWSEFLNLNRRVDDDDPENAKKAADDQDEIGLGQVSKAPATKLKLHLDLAPEDVDRERLSSKLTYPEWDVRSNSYLPDHVCVLASEAEADPEKGSYAHDPAAARRIRAVKRQFEAMRPGRVRTRGHLDGDDLDIEAAVRSQIERSAIGEGSDRIWEQTRPEARDLAVSILLDVSRSTESAVGPRSVIDIEREALDALAWGLDACGDDFAIHAFSSLKRNRVYVQRCKKFGEKMGPLVEQRLGTLRPGFYTRLGAAIRHVSADLASQARKRKLIMVITDGKPNDLDHYEGRHGIEDTMMAVREARRAGQSVYGVTVDRDGKAWFARMFGQGGFSVIADPDRLIMALPQIYKQLVGA